MAEVETEEVEKAEAEGREAREVRMYFKSDASKDQRRYNAPTGNGYSDIAAVFVGDNGEPPQYRDICIYPKTETIKRISVLSQNCDPMSFPLLFPNGETGWTINMEHGGARTNIRDKVTALQFYAYRLAIRDGFSFLRSNGKLFQQYVVNAYCNIETTGLQFIRSNQSLLRVDLYQGLLDHIQTRAVDENVKPGNLVILPSSFNGGPRAQQQRYQDSMAIVRKFGKPDLFITMTCNPLWDEITKSIEPYQLAQNRPDVVARVFNMKLQELLKDLTVRHVFGVPTAYMYSIEFQKRGLPHAHILLTLATEDKIRDKEDIDKVVSAEFPLENGRLFEIVKRNMVHGPCGAHNPKSPCMVDGKCSKGFPKDFAVETQENTNGYPQYKRRDDRIRVKVGRHEVSNQ